LASEITFKKVRVSDKGQISIPVDLQKEMGIKKGDDILLIRKGDKIVLEKPSKVIELLEEQFADVQAITEASLKGLWLNKKDEIWNQYLEPEKK
jgi:AbrB family looped-hinge helix DNA binding protein